ncbi:hypothetical protein QOZ83_05300 [Romboutsia sedimentorum]|uniref:hypothetical protein n=1 Tax=Romboutsia sedimentorum TaxID=1368474 RepID=UPI0024DE41EA|nr:hypothetical protein [Romboutsia sedimentorum]MDK2585272.1 hypothetical protein [Romboutsia sedimentorum]
MCISKEGEEFILDLNMYLMIGGRNEKEVKEFIEEAEQHLILGEKEGKSVKDIFGDSPEEYAKSVEKELPYDKKGVLNLVFVFIISLVPWLFLNQLNYGAYKTSVLEIIGIPLILVVYLAFILFFAKKFVFEDKKFKVSIFIISILEMVALVAVGLAGQKMEQVELFSEPTVSIIIIVLILVSMIIAITKKTTAPIFPFVINIPKILYYFFGMNLGNLDTVALLIGVALMFIALKIETNSYPKIN